MSKNEYDFIVCSTKEEAKNIARGVKEGVQSSVVEKDGKKESVMEIIAEKVTFLSSKKQEADE